MNDASSSKPGFNDIPDLHAHDIDVEILPGDLLLVQSINQNGEGALTIMLDYREAVALRDWLIKALS